MMQQDLAELQSKEVSPSEVLESAIAQIEQHNPSINAVVHTQFDKVRSQLRLAIQTVLL